MPDSLSIRASKFFHQSQRTLGTTVERVLQRLLTQRQELFVHTVSKGRGIEPDRLLEMLDGRDHPGLEQANANLMGQVTLSWDDEQTSRDALLDAMARGGFRPVESARE